MTSLAQQHRQMTLAALLRGVLPDQSRHAHLDGIVVRGLSQDSRRVRPGDVFLAVRGERYDAREFIGGAIASGAVAILADSDDYLGSELRWMEAVPVISIQHLRQRIGELASHFFGSPSRQVPVIGVTGTNGKTSLTQYIAQILEGLGRRCGVIGTLGSGIYPALRDTGYTTPDAVAVHSGLADLVDSGADCVAMEVSSQGIDQFRVTGVTFHSAVFTNLTRDHLDYHGTMAAYAGAKQKLFESKELQSGVVNADDLHAAAMISALPEDARSLTYGVATDVADVHISGLRLHASGFSTTVHSPWGVANVESSLLGTFNLSNVLAAVSAVMTLPRACDFNEVISQVHHLRPVVGRMQRVSGDDDLTVVVDYAHTPDGLVSALRAMRGHTQGRLWCVFGCGGERDRGKRPLMAQAAQEWAEYVIVTDDNPRHEDANQIVSDILDGFTESSNKRIIIERDRSAAIARAISMAETGDIVLIAGKGHESYQEIAGQRLPFSDTEHAAEALATRRQSRGITGGAL